MGSVDACSDWLCPWLAAAKGDGSIGLWLAKSASAKRQLQALASAADLMLQAARQQSSDTILSLQRVRSYQSSFKSCQFKPCNAKATQQGFALCFYEA